MKQSRKSLFSLAATAAIIVVLVMASPAQAVTLSTAVSSNGGVDSEVDFSLRADIAGGERIPIDNVTLVLSGPSGERTCVFGLDGTPLQGCEHLTIELDEATKAAFGARYGAGWDGSADVNTSFGNGYGYGSSDPIAVAWNVRWDTAGLAAGTYTIDYFISSSSPSASRLYKMKSVAEVTLAQNVAPHAELSVKESFPKGLDYAFRCESNLEHPVRYDWYFGDGEKLLDIANKDTYHSYKSDGNYTVTCVAKNADASATSSIDVTAVGKKPGKDYSTIGDASIRCVGGTMTEYTAEGRCRTVTCEDGSNALTVKACAAGEGQPKSLKMTRKGNPDSGLGVCFGSDCPAQ